MNGSSFVEHRIAISVPASKQHEYAQSPRAGPTMGGNPAQVMAHTAPKAANCRRMQHRTGTGGLMNFMIHGANVSSWRWMV
jgi:hypothetical protein